MIDSSLIDTGMFLYFSRAFFLLPRFTINASHILLKDTDTESDTDTVLEVCFAFARPPLRPASAL